MKKKKAAGLRKKPTVRAKSKGKATRKPNKSGRSSCDFSVDENIPGAKPRAAPLDVGLTVGATRSRWVNLGADSRGSNSAHLGDSEKRVAAHKVQLDEQAREIAEVAEEERRRLGRQLHDTLSQQLTAIGVIAATLREQREMSPGQLEIFDQLEAGIQEAKRQTRAFIRGLFPVDVDALGFHVAVSELAKETSSIFRVTCRVEVDGGAAIQDDFVAAQLYLIAREAVQNAARHAKASEIVVRMDDGDGARLVIEDDGQGLPEGAEDKDGMGLRIMHYRSGLIGGKLKIESREGRGTRVVLQMRMPK
jgi:signal transduction histidine kinase